MKASVDALSNILMMAHVGLAGVTNTPEIELEKDEADLLANSAVPVLDQFNFVPDPRFVAIFGLITASARVYGPRYVLIRTRKEAEREDKKASAAKPVYDSAKPAQNSGGFSPDLSATIPPEMMKKAN